MTPPTPSRRTPLPNARSPSKTRRGLSLGSSGVRARATPASCAIDDPMSNFLVSRFRTTRARFRQDRNEPPTPVAHAVTTATGRGRTTCRVPRGGGEVVGIFFGVVGGAARYSKIWRGVKTKAFRPDARPTMRAEKRQSRARTNTRDGRRIWLFGPPMHSRRVGPLSLQKPEQMLRTAGGTGGTPNKEAAGGRNATQEGSALPPTLGAASVRDGRELQRMERWTFLRMRLTIVKKDSATPKVRHE